MQNQKGWKFYGDEYSHAKICSWTGYLETFWAEPKHQGHGSRLVQQVERDFKFIYLYSLDESVNFWKKQKYKKCCPWTNWMYKFL